MGPWKHCSICTIRVLHSIAASFAAGSGRLDSLKWLHARDAPITKASLFSFAGGHKEILQWQVLAEMERHGPKPWVSTYNAAIRARGHGQHWEVALDLLAEMRRNGPKPNASTYTATISACGDCLQWAVALQLLAEMKLSEMERIGPKPDDCGPFFTLDAGTCAQVDRSQDEAKTRSLLEWLRQEGAPWYEETTHNAMGKGLIEFVKGLIQQGALFKHGMLSPLAASHGDRALLEWLT
ncbi:unnamed protein product [Polarella glacialis]|uniref:Pentatricopeptide repeat-containing protein n=1 Tax=Polarella glacialis TaxID=89957 RepID=A0A813HGV0_POLGL|nr:unnamed protein product [Polarella glacialis]